MAAHKSHLTTEARRHGERQSAADLRRWTQIGNSLFCETRPIFCLICDYQRTVFGGELASLGGSNWCSELPGESLQSPARLCQLRIGLGKAESHQVFAAPAVVKGASGDAGYTGFL